MDADEELRAAEVQALNQGEAEVFVGHSTVTIHPVRTKHGNHFRYRVPNGRVRVTRAMLLTWIERWAESEAQVRKLSRAPVQTAPQTSDSAALTKGADHD